MIIDCHFIDDNEVADVCCCDCELLLCERRFHIVSEPYEFGKHVARPYSTLPLVWDWTVFGSLWLLNYASEARFSSLPFQGRLFKTPRN